MGIKPTPETYPLDDAAIALLTELREQVQSAQIAMNTVIAYFARQHGLQGKITLAGNGRELILEPQTGAGANNNSVFEEKENAR